MSVGRLVVCVRACVCDCVRKRECERELISEGVLAAMP